VSDFLSRVAARAVGEAPVARPRLRALFDEPGATADPGVGIVDEQLGAEGCPAPASHAPSGAALNPPRARPPVTVEPPPSALIAESREAGTSARPRSAISPALSIRERDEQESDAAVASPEPESPAPSATAVPAPAAPTVRATPAVPALAPLTTAAPPAPATHAHDESPTVRVHIGRLEVRANLEEAPRPARREQDAPLEGLSLSDYLRGKRVAG
jgi:hypothetical protein